MDKRRLTVLLDVMIALAMIWMVYENLYIPGERTLAGFMEENIRRSIQRTAASELWLIALWAGMYRPWDGARRVSAAVVLLGALLALCVPGITYFTGLIISSYIARFSQQAYGGWMLLTLLVCFLLQLALERANADAPECVAASRRWRLALGIAFGVLCIGMIVCTVRYRQAMWYSVAAASLIMLAMTAADAVRKREA